MSKVRRETIQYSKLVRKVAIVWTRVSSERQEKENCSLNTQKERCEQYAADNGIYIKYYCGGQHESGKTEGELYKEMIQLALKDKEVNIILVYSFDRFSRANEAIVTKTKLKANGIYVISATQASDPDSSVGDFVENLSLLLGNFDNAMRTDKIRQGQQAQLERGNWPFQLPLGYERKKIGGVTTISITPEGGILKNAWIWRAQGIREVEIVNKLHSIGLTVTAKHLNKILKNPFYCGLIVHPRLGDGVIIQGNHEAIIDKLTFEQVNSAAHIGYTQAKETIPFPLKRHVFCEDCRGALTGYTRSRQNKTYYYYKCNTKGCCANISAKELHENYETLLAQYQIKIELFPIVNEIINNEMTQYYSAKAQNSALVKRNLTEIETQIENVEYRFAIGDINQNTYNIAIKKLTDEKNKIQLQLEEVEESLSNTKKMAEFAELMACRLEDCWKELDFHGRQKLQELIFPEGVFYNKKNMNYRTPVVNEVFRVSSRLSAKYSGDSNEKSDPNFSESPCVEKRRLERPNVEIQAVTLV